LLFSMLSPMRIVYVTETFPPEINGVALSSELAVRHLRAHGHQVQVLRPAQSHEEAVCGDQEWLCLGAPVPMYPDLRLGWIRAGVLRKQWRLQRPDVVHVVTPGPLAWTALKVAQAEGIATSADFRTNFHTYSRYYGMSWLEPVILAYLRQLHAKANCNFVPTPQLASQLSQQGFERLQVVGRGVDTSRFSPVWRDTELRRSWGAHDKSPVLLYVGRLAREKNIELALDCFEDLRTENPQLKMVVVGDGPLREKLQTSYPAVHFAGSRRGDELPRYYASADVFLFPSLTEIFGNVTLEALATGMAVVAFDTAAAALHVPHGSNGWLVPVNAGKAEFLKMVKTALPSAVWGHLLRRNARATALTVDWESILQRFELLLRRIAAAPELQGSSHAALA
jgi:glycosyltransferase involved in cell wall biosynthesis